MGECVASEERASSISARFYTTAPLAPVAAGCLLMLSGADVFVSSWSPKTLALTHLGTLGFLVMAFVGGLYAIVPGASDARLGGRSVADFVHAGLCIGVGLLVGGILAGMSVVTFAALGILAVTVLSLVTPVSVALARRRVPAPPGTRTAVVSLLLTAFLGLWMGHWHVGVPFHGERAL